MSSNLTPATMKIYQPKKREYQKVLLQKKKCFFCDLNIIQDQECTLFSFVYWRVLVNKYPYMDGNVMIVPKKHSISLSELSLKEWGEFPQVLLSVKKVLSKKFSTKSFNIGINIGEESGRSIDHLHWQIIPRKKKRYTVVSVLADIQVITISPQELQEMLSKKKTPKKRGL